MSSPLSPNQIQHSPDEFPDNFPEPEGGRPPLPVASIVLGAGVLLLIVLLFLAW